MKINDKKVKGQLLLAFSFDANMTLSPILQAAPDYSDAYLIIPCK